MNFCNGMLGKGTDTRRYDVAMLYYVSVLYVFCCVMRFLV